MQHPDEGKTRDSGGASNSALPPSLVFDYVDREGFHVEVYALRQGLHTDFVVAYSFGQERKPYASGYSVSEALVNACALWDEARVMYLQDQLKYTLNPFIDALKLLLSGENGVFKTKSVTKVIDEHGDINQVISSLSEQVDKVVDNIVRTSSFVEFELNGKTVYAIYESGEGKREKYQVCVDMHKVE